MRTMSFDDNGMRNVGSSLQQVFGGMLDGLATLYILYRSREVGAVSRGRKIIAIWVNPDFNHQTRLHKQQCSTQDEIC